MTPNGAVLLLLCASLCSAVRILSDAALRCPRQDLNCTASKSNCMDRKQLVVSQYTPSGPEDLQVSVDTRADETGQLHPILNAQWKIRDDGSISYLEATELHVLVLSTNQYLCVRYAFKEKLPMKSPSGEKWSFSANMLVLDPGLRYRVSVFNIPKPQPEHTYYDVSQDVTVSDCEDPSMHMTQFCIERGSLWRPNISVVRTGNDHESSALVVGFIPDALCEDYMVIVSCHSVQIVEDISKDHRETLNTTFSLNKWPRSCCQFDVEIKPLFPKCGEDCRRMRKTWDICTPKVKDVPDVSPYIFVAVGVVLMCTVIGLFLYFISKTTGTPLVISRHKKDGAPKQQPLNRTPKVLIIYSQDHHLYKDVVLKLCAFLQAKCGTIVLVDMLDSTSVSMVGRLRWLESQTQQLKNPSDKILVLCSRGVQAKWRALCGHGRVTLREDVQSPTDDMLTPFLNLFLPSMHQPGMLGKYMVAYFEDISSEQDVPSVFDIAVKYSLMKHFEELFFRILDYEKYQPGHVSHVEGIGRDEYFNCPSGKALKDAIETFQAFQLKHPDWFDKECLVSEEEILSEARPLIDQLQTSPVLVCNPLINNGPPVYSHKVEIIKDNNSICIVAPELNPEHKMSSVAQVTPVINSGYDHHDVSSLGEMLPDHLNSYDVSLEPVLNKTPFPRQTWLSLREEASAHIPTENDENNCSLSQSVHQRVGSNRSITFQDSVDSNPPHSLCMQSRNCSLARIHSQPVEMEENEDLLPSTKGSSSGSDQGYISKTSSHPDDPYNKDPLVALMRLQEKLFEQDFRHSDSDAKMD